MNDQLKKGRELVREKRFKEAAVFYELLASENPGSLGPIQELVVVAREQKNYALMLEYLDKILSIAPNHLESKILRRRLLVMVGGSILDLRNELDSFVELAKRGPLTPPASVQLLRAIQYCCLGSDRVIYLKTLLGLVCKSGKEANTQAPAYAALEAEILLALGDYSSFVESTNRLSEKFPQFWKTARLSRIAEKCVSVNFPDFSAPKVFGIGLSRTGTSSLNDALSLLGYHAIHWNNPHTLDLISPDDFCLFDAFTDIPVSYQFEVLYYSFPNAKFVYTTREIESWEKSITHHYDVSAGVRKPTELKSPNASQRFGYAAGYVENNLYSKFATWAEAYLEFENRVRTFFLDKPENSFLELKICEGEGWEKLCPFLGKTVPAKPFPNSNPSPPKGRGSTT